MTARPTASATDATTPTSSAAGAPARRRIAGLDGVRALAVALVVLFHLTPGAVVGGFLGVDVFFVVSGFIITRLLLVERVATGRIALGSFWLRRARRLLPALVALLLVCTSVAALIGGDVLLGVGAQLIAALTFSSNWYFIVTGSDYFASTAPELYRNLWSLAVEEQFYLLWPLVVLLVLVRMPRAARIVLLAVATLASAAAMALLLDAANPTPVYYGTGTHAFGLTLGALLAVASQWWSTRELEWSRGGRRALGVVGAIALAGIVALAIVMPGEAEWTYRGGLLAVAVLTAALIAALLVPGSPLARALDLAPVRWVGERSYSIYLWHWPVFVLLLAAIPEAADTTEGAWALGAVAAVITVGAAALSYRLVESGIRRDGFRATWRAWGAGFRASRRSALAGAMAVALVAAGVTGTTFAVVTAPAQSETQARIQEGLDAIRETPTPTPDATAAPGGEPSDDATGDDGDDVPVQLRGSEITAIGDSVMLAAVPELQAAFPGIQIDAVVSRQLSAAPGIIQKLEKKGKLRSIVVIALGTNGSIDRKTLDEIRWAVGAKRQVVLVTAQAPRGWIPGVNKTLKAYAWQYRDIELADWHAAIQPHLDVLAPDRVHFGGAGARIFTKALEAALVRLSELPPLRDDAANESLPRIV